MAVDAGKAIGISLAILAGLLIGCSFILKKKGLLNVNALEPKGRDAADNHSYLKSKLWWAGLIMMAVGEILNSVAYAFCPAAIITPLGVISVVVSASLSSLVLKERLNFSGKIGCGVCCLGSILVVLNAPETQITGDIESFLDYVIAPGFLIYFILILIICLYLGVVQAPKNGKRSPMVYISICSLIGALSVLSIQGFGSALVHMGSTGENQFTSYHIYMVLGFLIVSLAAEIHYLNLALNNFSTAIVTPIYYVFFTFCTLVSSTVLFKGDGQTSNAITAITNITSFIIIVCGVALLFEYHLKISKREARWPCCGKDRGDGEMGKPGKCILCREDDELLLKARARGSGQRWNQIQRRPPSDATIASSRHVQVHTHAYEHDLITKDAVDMGDPPGHGKSTQTSMEDIRESDETYSAVKSYLGAVVWGKTTGSPPSANTTFTSSSPSRSSSMSPPNRPVFGSPARMAHLASLKTSLAKLMKRPRLSPTPQPPQISETARVDDAIVIEVLDNSQISPHEATL